MFHANANTVKIAVSTGSTNKAMALDGASPHAMVSNFSSGWAAVAFGSSTITATVPTTGASAASYMVPPGVSVFLRPGKASTYIAAALSSGTGVVFATPGVLE